MEVFPDPKFENDFSRVYPPSDDTYLIMDYFKTHIDHNTFDGKDISEIERLLDMGTGTGIIALLLNSIKNLLPSFNPDIVASDINEVAVSLAKNNAKLNGFTDQIRFIHSDLFDSFPSSLKHFLDVIIFNPPYLPSFNSESQFSVQHPIDQTWDGGVKGHELFIKFLKQARDFLNLDRNPRIYYVCSSKVKEEELDAKIDSLDYAKTFLDKRHLFFEDIVLNRLEPK